MHVAFLGLGAIGRPMAAHLARPPFTLSVWNRTTERAAELNALIRQANASRAKDE